MARLPAGQRRINVILHDKDDEFLTAMALQDERSKSFIVRELIREKQALLTAEEAAEALSNARTATEIPIVWQGNETPAE